jgi:copper resistance protein C
MKKLMTVIAISGVLAAASALAHTELSQTVPADKAVLETAPKEVTLHFSEAVRLTSLSVTKQDGAAPKLGSLPAGKSQHFAVPAPELSAGAYTVEWRALSDDGHALRGAFGFTVGGATAPAQQPQRSDSADHSQHSEHSRPH